MRQRGLQAERCMNGFGKLPATKLANHSDRDPSNQRPGNSPGSHTREVGSSASTKVPGYPDTAFLKTMVHQREVGVRPSVELEPTDRPLAVDQRDGKIGRAHV